MLRKVALLVIGTVLLHISTVFCQEKCKKLMPPKILGSKCCKFPSMIGEEAFRGCGISPQDQQQQQQSQDQQGPPPCDKHICVMKNIGVMLDNEHVDKGKMKQKLDEYAAANPKYAASILKSKEYCIDKTLEGPPEICEPIKITTCIGMVSYMECPDWEQSSKCNEIKQMIEDCKKEQ